MTTPASFQGVYPPQLAEVVQKLWLEGGENRPPLPSTEKLIVFLEVLFAASFLREEGRPILCRVILSDLADWSEGEGPPAGFQSFPFTQARPLSAHEIRKLAPAAGYYRSLIGVQISGLEPEIWGILQSGTRWVNRVSGGRYHGPPMGPSLVGHILGPGHLLITCGYERLVELKGGLLLEKGFDPFKSKWLPAYFQSVRVLLQKQLSDQHLGSTVVENDFISFLAQNVIRRTLSLVQSGGHGGLLIILPISTQCCAPLDQILRVRCTFTPTATTRTFNRLILKTMGHLQQLGQQKGLASVSWKDYQSWYDPILTELDESMLEIGHLFADLMAVDGALVMNERFQLIGFGAEVLGHSHVETVEIALDLEGTQTRTELAESLGTRHRSAYRLIAELPKALVTIISQDGSVQFVANRDGKVTCWPFLP